MIVAWILAALLLILLILYLLALRPQTNRHHLLKPFEQTLIAHRGFFDNAGPAPENSIPAFQRAVEHGYGIELDVQLTTDHRLVVFHDATLKRMCGVKKSVSQCTYEELQKMTLADSPVHIPLFRDVLTSVNGKVPLIIEIKPEGDCMETARVLADALDSYHGTFCIESFHPGVVFWFRKNRPHIARGILSTDYKKNHLSQNPFAQFFLSNLLLNWLAKPDFIAYNHKYVNQFSYRLCRRLYHVVHAAWTIRSEKELEQARKHFSIFIFDSFRPE